MQLTGHFAEIVRVTRYREPAGSVQHASEGERRAADEPPTQAQERGIMDRRQRKTRQAIYDAFEYLMQDAHYSTITVAQIIDRADIGRSTFYAHFETKDELLDQMCVEMFDHIFEGVNAQCVTHSTLETNDLEGLLAHLLYHLRDTHGAVCGKLLKEGEPHFVGYFRMQLRRLFEARTPAIPVETPRDLALDLLVTSFVESIVWWFDQGAKTKPEDLARWFLLPFKN
jgi:AcrR family transcriptional regulator